MAKEDMSPGERLIAILQKRQGIKGEFLREIREEAQTTGRRVEKLLVERNVVTHVDMALAISEYLRIPPITLTHFMPDSDLLKLVPKEILMKDLALPVCRIGRMLTVALGDPFNVIAVEELHVLTKLDIVPLAAVDTEVSDLLERFVGEKTADLEQTALDMEETDVEVSQEEKEEVSLEDALDKASGAPVIRVVNTILVEAIRKHASDAHLEPMEKTFQLRYRIDGILYAQPSPPKSIQMAITSRIKILGNLNIAERRVPQDGRFRMRAMGKEYDVRLSMLPTVHGEKIVMRILDKSTLMPNLAALGLDQKSYENMKYAVEQPTGMILITGPTGCGKTTTLYSALQELNRPTVNIVTIEDPVEYQLGGVNQVQARPDVGLSYAVGLRSILRQAPNIVMVGEIHDDETATIAVQAALSGHLVLSTLHTNDAAGAVARMLYMGIDALMLSSSLILTQSQRLYRKLCTACRVEQDMPHEILRLNRIDPERLSGVTLFRAQGCPKCYNTGYKGRGALMEILLVNAAMRELILKQTSASEIRMQAVKNGMLTLRDVGIERLRDGLTSIEEVLLVTGGD